MDNATSRFLKTALITVVAGLFGGLLLLSGSKSGMVRVPKSSPKGVITPAPESRRRIICVTVLPRGPLYEASQVQQVDSNTLIITLGGLTRERKIRVHSPHGFIIDPAPSYCIY